MSVKTGQSMKYKIIWNYVKSCKIVSFFFTGNRDVFGTQSNVYIGAFFVKKVNSQKSLTILAERSTIDFWLGS